MPGGLEESRRDTSTSILLSFLRAVQPLVAGSLVAMTKPVSRDAKLKGPKESTGRALVNCASAKYRSSPIKPMSLDMSLEHWSRAKALPLQVLQCSFAASNVHSLRRVRPAFSCWIYALEAIIKYVIIYIFMFIINVYISVL